MLSAARHTARLARRFSTAAAVAAPSAPMQHAPLLLTEDEAMIQEAARSFAATEVAPLVRDMDRNSKMDDALIAQLFENGFMGVEADEADGGSGGSFTAMCSVIEELAKVDPAVATCVDVHGTVVANAVRFWGSDALRARWLPRLAQDTVGSFCLSEPGSGSDAFALRTRAVADGDGYVLSGGKAWITNAEHAGLFLVFATVDPGLGYKGITCFAVERGAQGLEVGPPEDKLGIRASSTCPVTLDGVRVAKEAVLGDVGQGYKYAIGILNEGRIGIGAQMVGLARGCFDATLPYLFERTQFGTRLGDFQAMEAQYAEVEMEIEAARLLVYNAARRKEAGLPFVAEAAMAKLKASRVAELSASRCIEWLGGVGFVKDYPAEKFFRDCKIGAIYEGTSNIQLITIAKGIKARYS
mmetsp:Transcript_20077/g.59846  ORF Transcript_20077/g.59846 Transcript_20077/m.59846 type:complete len:412 (+) Transcript_20077:938-2173(+)